MGNVELYDLWLDLNLIFILGYLIMVLVFAFFALLTNYKRLQKMSYKEQFMFFVWQPYLFIKEIRESKK